MTVATEQPAADGPKPLIVPAGWSLQEDVVEVEQPATKTERVRITLSLGSRQLSIIGTAFESRDSVLRKALSLLPNEED